MHFRHRQTDRQTDTDIRVNKLKILHSKYCTVSNTSARLSTDAKTKTNWKCVAKPNI